MEIIKLIRSKAQQRNKTIILPEIEDIRVRQAAEFIEKEGIAKILLLGDSQLDAEKIESYAQSYYQLQKHKGITPEDAKRTLQNPLYYAAMMTRVGEADGFVAGAAHTTPDVARAAIHCLGVDEKINIASSCFLISVPDCVYGQEGAFIFADCGIIPEPTSRQLACIAVSSAGLAKEVLGITPAVAFLSYSTKGSAKSRSQDKIREALGMAHEMDPALLLDGELQVDAAIVPEVAEIKYPDSPVKGRANVLVFPNLDAGNISYKLVQRLAKARAAGPLILGLNKPCSDLSRGCSVEEIIDCVAITAIRAR